MFIPHFEKVAGNYPNTPAIVENGFTNCTYWELGQRAKQLAAVLQKNGCRPGDVVAISIEKSAAYIRAMLAVWYCGAAFVPIDPALPADRIELMCRDASVKFVMLNSENVPSFFESNSDISRVFVDQVKNALPFDRTGERLDLPTLANYSMPGFAPDDLAYIIFTSGSTGIPKGVLVTHRGITSFLWAQIEAFGLDEMSRSLWYLSTSFDASVSDLGTALLSGTTIYIEPPSRLQPGGPLEEVLRERGITYIDIPPSILRLLDPAALPACLKTVVIGGEACSLEVVRAFAARVNLINVYGPTESTVCTSLGTCGTDWERPLIGQPLPGITYYVLDEDLNEIGPLAPGQLHIGGIGLADGYLNRPELTAAKFITHPQTGERLYRTGDLIMITEDAEYQFLGRTDRQFKLRGMLIEPEEIEAKLLQHPDVERAGVVKRPVKAGTAREILVAFVTAKDASGLDLEALRAHLAMTLPKWMIPQKIQELPTMPLTVTGKVDLSALKTIPLTFAEASTDKKAGENASEIARILAQVFVQVLGIDTISADDDFFEVGGDSFAVVEAAVAASALGLQLPPGLLMAHPTIAALTLKLSEGRDSDRLTASGGITSAAILDDIAFSQEILTLIDTAKVRPAYDKNSPQKIFFTGATGFLGARLLHEFLSKTDAEIYCLVRADNGDVGLQRLNAAINKHGLDFQSFEKNRIKPVCGTLEIENFGLPAPLWQSLCDEIDTVVHCAASVNNLASYADLRPTNLGGTVEVARMCLSGRQKSLHYASTLSVFVATDKNRGDLLETDDLSATEIIYGGYAGTKWAAEIFLRRLSDYVPTTIHRLGLITGDSDQGRGADHDFLKLFIRGICSLGAAPEITTPVSIDITPVDFAARAMAALCLDAMASGSYGTFHLANSSSLELARLLSLLGGLGVTLRYLAPAEFKSLLAARAGGLSAAEAAACLALCRLSGDDFGLFRTMDLFQATDVRFDTTRASAVLDPMGIRCPAPSDRLVSIYLQNILANA